MSARHVKACPAVAAGPVLQMLREATQGPPGPPEAHAEAALAALRRGARGGTGQGEEETRRGHRARAGAEVNW